MIIAWDKLWHSNLHIKQDRIKAKRGHNVQNYKTETLGLCVCVYIVILNS